MEKITQSEYERWLRENNVPYYKRALYDDDPERVMAAVKKEQERMRRLEEERAAELQRQRAAERARGGRSGGAYLYGDGEDTAYREEDDFDVEDGDPEDDIGVTFDDEDGDGYAAAYVPQKIGLYATQDETGSGQQASAGRTQTTRQNTKTKNKKSDSAKKAGRLVFSALLAAVVVLIIGIAIVNSIDFGTYKLGYITMGEVTEQGEGTAYFARSSELITSPDKGIFMAVIDEGDRIDAGGTVGYIVKEENKSVLSRLKQVNATILALMNMGDSPDNTEREAELEAINVQIAEKRAQLTEMALRGDLRNSGDVENEINALIAQRDGILVDAESGSDSILSLKREKEDLERVVSEKMTPVISLHSGIVSFRVSDSEEVENELYNRLAAGNGSADLASLQLLDNAHIESKLNASVEKGDTVCRIIRNQDYFIVLKISKKTDVLSGLVTVKSGDLTFQAAGNVNMSLYGDDYAVVSTMRGLKNSLSYKNIDVTYDVSKSGGYCVPLSALSDWDKNNTTARIAIVKAGFVQFKYVGIKAWDDEKAIITSSPFDGASIVYSNGDPVPQEKIAEITAGTCYVVDAGDVKDGQQIS